MSAEDHISIQGTLLMLDDATPHVAVPVQAIRDGEVIATTLSDERGTYRFDDLEPGIYQLRCQVLGGCVYYGEEKAGTALDKLVDLQIEQGESLKNINFRFAPFKKGTWRNYYPAHGLASTSVHSIHEDSNGVLWFASCSWNSLGGDGVSCYDGREFAIFTTEDGLTSNDVWTIHSTPDGVLWFGTRDNGVSRYDGREFVNFTTVDGLVHNDVRAIDSTPDGVLWFGTFGGGISRYDGNTFTNFTVKDGLASNQVNAVHCDPDGTVWFGTWNGVSRYDGNDFINFPTDDGLLNVTAIHRDSKGILWFGTGDFWNPGHGVFRYNGKELDNLTYVDGLKGYSILAINSTSDDIMWFGTEQGLSRYDGEIFVNFGIEEGLLYPSVEAIHISSDGALWLGTGLGGVARYDEKSFVSLNVANGLPGELVQATYRSSDGSLWIGTVAGIARYDDKVEFGPSTTFTEADGWVPRPVSVIHGSADGSLWFGTGGIYPTSSGIFRYSDIDGTSSLFVNLTTKDGLAHNRVHDINSEADGTMWVGTAEGASRYDGMEFVNFATEDGLAGNRVDAIHRDANGILWFGTSGGVSRYDGKEFVNLTTEDGLAHNWVRAIHSNADGILWFGARHGGVSCYDGEEFINFTQKDELAGDSVRAVYCALDGITWFGIVGGGVSGFDGVAWTSLDTRDGLLDDRVLSIDPDTDGSLWIGTRKGVTHYRRNEIPPRVQIVSVTTDKTYHDLSIIPPFNPGTRVTVSYNAIDLKTLPEKRQYRCCIREMDTDWRKPTKSDTFDLTFDEPGTYTFQVQAIDRDLNYSEPALVKLEVIPDPRNHRIIQLEAHIREQELAEMERMQQELEDARQIQRSLLPAQAPELQGFEIAGISLPAREVSGDFYSYLSLGDNTGIVLADITGKSVRAAMVAALASGTLNAEIKGRTELWNSPSEILSELNTGLHPHLIRGMYTAMSLGILQPIDRRLVFSNAGMPYPIVKRGSEVWELEVNGMPLGLTEKAEYEDLSVELEPGDLVVFCSDGVIEAENQAEEMYQSERLLRLIQQADPGLSAQEMVDLVVRNVAAFTGDVDQSDDTTVVVLWRKE